MQPQSFFCVLALNPSGCIPSGEGKNFLFRGEIEIIFGRLFQAAGCNGKFNLLLLILVAVKAVKSGDAADIRAFWTLVILFLGGGLLMSLSYLGEVRSIWRHVLGGVLALRITLWLAIAALFSTSGEAESAD